MKRYRPVKLFIDLYITHRKGRTRQTLWGAEQMLTQKHVAKRYMIAKK